MTVFRRATILNQRKLTAKWVSGVRASLVIRLCADRGGWGTRTHFDTIGNR